MIWSPCGLCELQVFGRPVHTHFDQDFCFFSSWSLKDPPPARGACPLGPVLWPWVKAPTLFGKQGLRSYLLIMWLTISHVEAYPTWLVRRGSEDVWSPHFDRIVKYFFRLPGKYSASWYQQCGRQLGEETLPVVLEIASALLGSLFVFFINGLFMEFASSLVLYFDLRWILYRSNSLFAVCLVFLWVLWIPTLGLF